MAYSVRLKQSAFGRFLKCYTFEHDGVSADILQYLNDCKNMLSSILELELGELGAVKFWLCVTADYAKTQDTETMKSFHFPNRLTTLLHKGSIDNSLVASFESMRDEIERFEKGGSDWVLVDVVRLDLHIAKYQPLKGSSYVELPAHIRKKHAVINVKNNDNQCFKWSLLAHLHPMENHPERVSQYYRFEDELNFAGISFPMEIDAVEKFCTQNPTISVNIYSCEGPIHPIRLSKERRTVHVNLLYYKKHFSLIRSFDRLMGDQNCHRARKYFCDICLIPFYSLNKLNSHKTRCCNPTLSQTKLPTEKTLKFTNNRRTIRRPVVVYADFECILEPLDSASRNPSTSYTEKVQKHTPCAFGAIVSRSCCDNKVKLDPYKHHTGPDCVKDFLFYLTDVAKSAKQDLNRYPHPNLSVEEERNFQSADTCWICEKGLGEDRVRDHCHVCGNFRGAAHARCNSQLQVYGNEIVVVFHNLRRYDGHIVIRELGNLCAEDKSMKLSCIAKSTEDYIAFTLKKWVSRKRLNDASDEGYRMIFIDSCQFLSSSLDNLVKDLPPDNFYAVESNFRSNDIDLLKRKGIFCYDHLKSWDRLDERDPPAKEAFFNKLTGQGISDQDYEHVLRVWQSFNVKSLREYMELYLKLDALLLCDVFEGFRKFALSCFNLDPCHYFTLPSFGWDSCLKLTEAELELLDDVDMYTFLGSAVRGGISTICHRYAKANNKYLPDFNPNDPSSHILYLDKNNLYGWAMERKLPTSGFRWLTEQELDHFDITTVDPDGDEGFLLEVDLDYPTHLHDRHNDYPLAAERVTIDESMLSPFCNEALGGAKHIGTPKLCPNLANKRNYIVHAANLKFYVAQGLVLKKIHRGLRFRQSDWMTRYIRFNTERRRLATSEFVKTLHKLLVNAVFGKTMENVRKYLELELVTSAQRLLKVTKKPEFTRAVIFTENLAACLTHPVIIKLNKPIYSGVAILELSKLSMYEFYYLYIAPRYGPNARVLMTDTDSFILQLFTEDVYEDMKESYDLFDTSNYPVDHFLFSNQNKSVVGKMKDETRGEPISEFVGLRSKMYSYSCRGQEHKRAKGITRSVVCRHISHGDYKQVLDTGTSMHHEMMMIRSYLHELYTVKVNKKSLACFDDKRYILDDGISTLAHGHYRIRAAVGGGSGGGGGALPEITE